MLTFDGKSASFVPGKEIPNKEPAVSKFVVEKLYKVHRERVLNMEPVIKSRIEIPDFLTNTSWKKITEQHRHEVIRKENEVIYQRIARVENLESHITKSSREHKQHVEKELTLMKNLKLKGRIRDFLKVQRENEDMLKRIERARPEYTLKGCKEWYKHHELFKAGRRSDPTAGHLGFKTLKGLLPKKMEPVLNSSLDCALNSVHFKAEENAVNGTHMFSQTRGNTADGRRRHSSINSTNNKIARGVLGVRAQTSNAREMAGLEDSTMDQNSMFNPQESLNAESSNISLSNEADSLYEQMKQIGMVSANAQRPKTQSRQSGTRKFGARTTGLPKNATDSVAGSSNRFNKGSSLEEQGEGTSKKMDEPGQDGADSRARAGSMTYGSEVFEAEEGSVDALAVSAVSASSAGSRRDQTIGKLGFQILQSRPFTIPFASTVIVQLLSCTGEYSDEILIRIVSGNGKETLAERAVPIDTVFDVVSSTNSSSILHSAGSDLSSVKELLITLFKEADDDKNGYLTYDEFETLMEKVELGISKTDLRYVIQEADENENGVVEFDEFVPLAVDLIQSFRSVNRARIYCSQRDAMFQDEVHEKMKKLNIEKMTSICLAKIAESDPKNYGVMRIPEFRRCLNSIAYATELTEGDIAQITHRLPLDAHGRLLYNGLHDVLTKVKYNGFKTAMVREQGGELQKWLFDRCAKEELIATNAAAPGDKQIDSVSVGVGRISAATLSTILRECKLNLSRLQICVLLAGNVIDGEVDYLQFAPVAVKAIQYMFEPKALRQRAELIQKTDLSSENLLNALTQSLEMLTDKVSLLFKQCDVNHSGSLSLAEFVLVMKSLEFELTDEEIEAYFFMIPLKSYQGEITLPEIVDFLKENLAALQRKKQNRRLAAELHANHTAANSEDQESSKQAAESLEKRLRDIFSLSDTEGTGFATREEYKTVLQSLNLGISDLDMNMIIAEADRSDGLDDGLIDYMIFLPECVKLLQTFIAREIAAGETASEEKTAFEMAEKIATASRAEIIQVAHYLYTRLQVIDQQIHQDADRRRAVHELTHNPHSGLTKTEGKAFMAWLFDDSSSSHLAHAPSKHLHPVSEEKHSTESEADAKGSEERKTAGAKGEGGEMAAPDLAKSSKSRASIRSSSKAALNTKSTANSKTAKRQLKLSMRKTVPTRAATRSLRRTMQDLMDILHDIRRNSIMRGILHDMSPVACTNLILSHIEQIREEMIAAGLLEPVGIYVPVKVCYQALSNATELRLNRSQILSIVSWATCYDKSGTQLDYQSFAEGAAKVIAKIFDPAHLNNRANILQLDHEEEEEASIMNGLQEEDLVFFLKQSFESMLIGSARELPLAQCMHVLKELPLLKLTDQEAASAIAACTGINLHVDIDELITNAYDILRSICRERFINRRSAIMALSAKKDHGSSQDKEALQEAIQLAEKFIDFVKVRQSDHTAQGSAGKPVFHVILPVDLSPETKAEQAGTNDAVLESDEMSNLEVELISGRRVSFPVREKPKPSIAVHAAMEVGMNNKSSAHKLPKPHVDVHHLPATFTGILKIVAVEKVLAMDRDMLITVTADDGRVASVPAGAVKLPMLCAVDKSLALEFTDSFLSRLYVEMDSAHDKNPIIKVGEGKVGGDRNVDFHVLG